MALAANKSSGHKERDTRAGDDIGRHSATLTEIDLSGWNWFSGNSKNIAEKLKYGLSLMRHYIKDGYYKRALDFSHE